MTEAVEVHFFGKVAQKAIIYRDDTVLLMRDSRELEEVWELPGGRLNDGEAPKAGLARELKEELGADFVIHDAVFLKQFWQGSDQQTALLIVYTATMIEAATQFVLPPEEVAEVRWVGKHEWQNLKLYPEYYGALEAYFTNL